MNRPMMFLASAVAAVWAVASALAANAETFSLQLKRLETVTDRSTGPPSDYMFRGLMGQRFQRQTGMDVPGAPGRADEDEFAKVITKEPSYKSKSPFRGVATLGTQKFGFVLDTDKPAPEAERAPNTPAVQNYNRLYFDLNGNGDLTDDAVIESLAPGNVRYPPGYASFSFPRVDLTVDVDGTQIDYAFSFSGSARSLSIGGQQQVQYVYASLSAAAYREGEITVDGQTLRVVVTDFNSNGRFDDLTAPDPNVNYGDGSVYLRPGDMIFVDPQPKDNYGYDVTTSDAQHYLAKTIRIGERFYDLEITPAGDQLTVKPSTREVGHVSNPHQGYHGLAYGDLGVLKIVSDEDGRAMLPEGSWKLHSYTLDRTGHDQTDEQADAAPSLLQTLASAVFGSAQSTGPRPTRVSARMTGEQAAFAVRPGETAELKFGPPYTPKVTAAFLRDDQLSLDLSLIGVGGEVCSSLMVDGARPGKPAFTITDAEGKIVQTGTFEYG